MTQPFLRWLDPAYYIPAPGGNFEGRTTWALSGGASMVSTTDPYAVSGTKDKQSLTIPSGGSAVSPEFCAGLEHPTIRFLSKGGGLAGTITMELVYTDNLGLIRSQALGRVLPSMNWTPATQMLTLAGLPVLTGSRMSIRLTANGGSFLVDDVYVDPFSRT